MESNQDALCGGCSHQPPTEHARDGIGRRTFLAQTALLAAGAVLAACAAGDATDPGTTVDSTSGIKVSDFPALASVGGIALVNVSGNPLAIVRTGDASFVTLSRICPHQGNTINPNGSGFLCPGHGARFSATGQWQGGERTSNMRSYATSYDAAAGTITIG
ncbi:MAG: Rieske (2Fe-2S) protein [Gemmatimonadetes bacterium]|jgi:cytochrome b6-f complex iron-sulfur subunit|nr:Rieske (2Fe-2S) protein [Gemmatimonadota bacterium]